MLSIRAAQPYEHHALSTAPSPTRRCLFIPTELSDTEWVIIIMDQTQQKALNALEPYILLSKSATSPRAAADLVKQATSSPNTFIFAELLQTPNIQALATGPREYTGYFALLQIFAWGTWEDYQCMTALPPIIQAILLSTFPPHAPSAK